MKLSLKSLVWVASFLLAFGCTSKKDSSPVTQKGPRVVNVATWSNYLSDDLIQSFEKKTGIQVQISNFSSNEELLAKLQTGSSDFDLIFPSDYMVFTMSKLGLLHELDPQKIPNSQQIDPQYLKRDFDPSNRFSVPYDWGTTGIGINRKVYQGSIKSWKDLFEKPELAGKFSLLDDSREVMGAALKSLGYSMNTNDPQQVKQAKELLFKARSRVKSFLSEPLTALETGEVPVTQIYMTDALQARQHKGDFIEYIIPEEGSSLWMDNLAIPARSKHIQEAHELMNFLLEPSSSLEIVKKFWVAPTHRAVFALLPKEMQSNSMLFPSPAVIKRCEMVQDLGEATVLWDRAWTEIKALNK